MNNEEKVTNNEQKLTGNKQKLTSKEKRLKSFTLEQQNSKAIPVCDKLLRNLMTWRSNGLSYW